MSIAISLAVGVLSSLVATAVVLLRQRARLRLRMNPVLHLIEQLARRIVADNYIFDYVVTIDRNSAVAGTILAGNFGLRSAISVTTQNTRRPDGSRDISLDEVSAHVLTALGGKRLLVFICCNDSGTSLNFVVESLKQLSDPPAEIRTAALYSSQSPAIMPRYRVVVVGRDTRQSMNDILERLPWVTKQWLHPLAQERHQKP